MFQLFRLMILLFLSSQLVSGQWEKVTNIPPPFDKNYWLEMYFLPNNPNYGWVCGYNGYTLRTTDGGKTWQGTIINTAYQLEHIQFVNERVGFTSGLDRSGFGRIYKTTNGGVGWFDITPREAEDLWGHYFVDENFGLVIGGGCFTPQSFFLTTDGGRTWRLQQYLYPNSGLTDLVILEKGGLGFASSSGRIWITRDGGYNWDVFSHTGREDWQEDIWVKGNTILVPYSTNCTGDGNTGGARISLDLGKTWKDFYTGQSMFGAFLFDSLRGWVCGWSRAVYYTSNGGVTWELLNCGIDNNVSLDDFWFINDTLGWVIGEGIYRYVGKKTIQAKINVVGELIACEGDTVVLRAENNTKHILWSTGATTKEIKVTKRGIYELYAWDTDCDSVISANVFVDFVKKPSAILSVPAKVNICEGDTIKVWIQKKDNWDGANWWWNVSKAPLDTIIVTKQGKYTLYVQSQYCFDSVSFEINLFANPKPKVQIVGRTEICEGDSVRLYVEGNFRTINWFRKDNPDELVSTQRIAYAKKSGKYFAFVETTDGCSNYSDTVEIIVKLDSNSLEVLNIIDDRFLVFGKVLPRELKCLELEIRNRTDRELVLPYLFLTQNVSFSTALSAFPMILRPFSSAKIPICFLPRKIGKDEDTVIINDICSDHIIVLNAEVIPNEYFGTANCDVQLFGRTISLGNKNQISIGGVYPNPANQVVRFNVLSNQNISLKVSLMDVLGSKFGEDYQFYTKTNKLEEFEIDCSKIDNGLYFLLVSSDEFGVIDLLPFVVQR